MHEAKCPSPVYVILTTHTTRTEYEQGDDVQTRRAGRTNDIALRVNGHTKRKIESVQKKIKSMSDDISELKDLIQQVHKQGGSGRQWKWGRGKEQEEAEKEK